MSSLFKKYNNIDMFGLPDELSLWGWQTLSADNYKIIDGDESYQIVADMPGIKEDDIEITVQKNAITIKAHRKDIDKSYHRRFALPQRASPDAITADLNYGVLAVTVPKLPEEKPRRIQIRRT
jgi:HSP20 family protein